MKKKFNILFLSTLNGGTVWFRMENFRRYMTSKKVDVALYPRFDKEQNQTCIWEHKLKEDRILKEILKLVDYSDIVVAQKMHSAMGLSLIEMIQDRTHKPILMETDDDATAVDSRSPSYVAYNPGSDYEWWFTRQLSKSDGVIVSTPYLKERFSQYNNNIHVIRNGIDFSIWDKAKKGPEHPKIRIGWMGSCTHFKDLELVWPAIETILNLNKNVEFYCIGYDPELPKNDKIHVIPEWVSIDGYPDKMKKYNFDIGIGPLADSYFNRAKSNLRFLEYSAMKVPCVLSDVEPFKSAKGYAQVVDNSVDSWVSALQGLIDHPSKRKKLGHDAYEFVKKNYNVEKISELYIDTLKKVKKEVRK
jgi:O-antigen biosynthesis protein